MPTETLQVEHQDGDVDELHPCSYLGSSRRGRASFLFLPGLLQLALGLCRQRSVWRSHVRTRASGNRPRPSALHQTRASGNRPRPSALHQTRASGNRPRPSALHQRFPVFCCLLTALCLSFVSLLNALKGLLHKSSILRKARRVCSGCHRPALATTSRREITSERLLLLLILPHFTERLLLLLILPHFTERLLLLLILPHFTARLLVAVYDVPQRTPQPAVPQRTPQPAVPQRTPQPAVPQRTPQADVPQRTPQPDVPQRTPQAAVPQRTPVMRTLLRPPVLGSVLSTVLRTADSTAGTPGPVQDEVVRIRGSVLLRLRLQTKGLCEPDPA
ncbi:hypothetical protein EYF80_064491 [Liparis tanakae]|uniref:Uncharacterized protein n=1 Tax=Liparis tanakae TaxID=230148 RepID=A0A4Z2E9F6_9TELE|nr:hypothetical protein EYF80_064491 [Liparis tanakae]